MAISLRLGHRHVGPTSITNRSSNFRHGSEKVPFLTIPLWKNNKSFLQFVRVGKLGTAAVFDGRTNRMFGVMTEFFYDHRHHKMVLPDVSEVLVLASTMTLALPLEALAETCQADNSSANMPLFFAVAIIGAAVGGLLARKRKDELKRLNNQLRQINTALKRQAKIESFAPSLIYSPVGRTVDSEIIVDPRKQQLVTNLRTAKNFLRNEDLDKAVVEFRAAFKLAENLGDHLEEKKAARGLGASLIRQGKYREAIKHYSKILELSRRTGQDSGNTEAYGAIADCYAELGDLERAAKFYDKYIARLGPND